MNSLAEIAGILSRLKSAAIFTHMRPDGDTIGSGMALCRALGMLGIRAEVLNEGDIPEKFYIAGGGERILRKPSFDAEAFICVDASDETRLGELRNVFLAGARRKITVNIDHHVSNTRFCKYNFVRGRASNCENIAELVRLLGVKPDRVLAGYLFMGMVTDSGGFSHDDVNGDTFREAAYAADAGANVREITYEIFKKQSRARAELYLETLSRLRYFLDGRLAVATVFQNDLVRRSLTQDATEGIVDFALTVDTVEISACLLEMKKGQFKVSLRSKGKANVNEMARAFGGGGHVLASGCMLFGETEEIMEKLCCGALLQLGES